MLPTVAVIIDSIYNNFSIYLPYFLLFVIPVSYLALLPLHNKLPRQPKVAKTITPTKTVVLSSDSQTSTDSTSTIDESRAKNVSTNRLNGDDTDICHDDDFVVTSNEIKTKNPVNSSSSSSNTSTPTTALLAVKTTSIKGTDDNDYDDMMNVWKCNCYSGQQFLPKSIFGNMEAILKMGTGECYHK
jgi:hypothetical protein